MTHTPSEALATEIGGQVGSLTLGTNLFHSGVLAPDSYIPINCVFVWPDGGARPLRSMGDPDEIRRTLIVIRVRNAKQKTGRDLALSIINALRGRDIATYLDLVCATSGPRMLGQSADGHHYFGAEFILTYQEP